VNEALTDIRSANTTRLWWKNWFGIAGLLCLVIAVVGYWLVTGESTSRNLQRGQLALARGDFSQAVKHAERAVQLSPQLASGWKLLAEAAGENSQLDRAGEAFDEYARQQPDEAGKFGLRLGRNWMNKNKVRPAILALKLAERLDPTGLEALHLQVKIGAVTGHDRAASRCIVELLKRKATTRGDMLLVTSLAAVLLDTARLEAILNADQANKSPLLIKVHQELDQNHYVEAERLLLEITASNPEDFEAQGALAELYASYLPEKFFHWHAQLPPPVDDDSRIWSARGKWLAQAGRLPESVRCLYESLLREPEQLSTTALLGQLLKSINEPELGNAFTERNRHLQRIIDLNKRLNEDRADEFLLPMIDELEAAGRLWEAWGWCEVHEQTSPRVQPSITERKKLLELQLSAALPRTRPGSLPGQGDLWERFPLPDWQRLESLPRNALPISEAITSDIRFTDRSKEIGLEFRFVNSYSPQQGRKIFESMGAGVAVLDYDGDGWPDLYFPQGNTSPTNITQGPSDRLFKNQRGERYVEVTSLAGIHELSYSQGVAAGDYDNDGFADVYVANLGRNQLFRNNGDGTYSNVTVEAGLQQSHWTESCAIADLNGDGLPELIDVNYLEGKELLTRSCTDAHGNRTVCRPTLFDPSLDTIAINLGDGQFREQQAECGLDLPQGPGLGLIVADFDEDDRLDLFVANDMTANFLLMNEKSGPGEPLHFRDEAFLRGVALDQNGLAQACMGVACADINRDGQPDLFVTNFTKESNALYLSQPGNMYQDQAQVAGLRTPSFNPLGFGTQFLDANNDGWYDLTVMNGHIDKFVGESFQMKAQFFRGHADGRFSELFASQAGELFDKPRLGRGLALLDWNRDGRTDFVATDLEEAALLAENQSDTDHRALRIKLVGTTSSRDAIGAKVRVTVAPVDMRFVQLTAGDGYQSSNERQVCVGVGSAEKVDSVEIKWPSGQVTRSENVRVDREWLVIEGRPDWLTRP